MRARMVLNYTSSSDPRGRERYMWVYLCVYTSTMAHGKGPTGRRLERIRRMHKMLQGVGDVDLIRFLASCEYQMGLTRRRIREYLRTLEDLGFIEVDEDNGIIREVVKE